MAQFTQKQNSRKDESVSNLYYWQQYQLNRDPFSAISDPSIDLLLPSWERHFDLLQHLINKQNVLIAIDGDRGIGKSTFLRLFRLHVKEAMNVHMIHANSDLVLNNLVRVLQEGFKLSGLETEFLEERLDALISEIQFQEQICLLIIDDAHELPEESILALLYLIKQQSVHQMRLHVLMAGNEFFKDMLMKMNRKGLTDDVIHSLDLEPFSIEETRRYLQHRMIKAGMKGPQPFTQQIVEQIHRNAEGIAENINRQAQQFLQDHLTNQEAEPMPSFFSKYQTKILGGICIAVWVLGIVLYLIHNNNAQMIANNDQKQDYLEQTQPVALADNQQTSVSASTTSDKAIPPQENKNLSSAPTANFKPAATAQALPQTQPVQVEYTITNDQSQPAQAQQGASQTSASKTVQNLINNKQTNNQATSDIQNVLKPLAKAVQTIVQKNQPTPTTITQPVTLANKSDQPPIITTTNDNTAKATPAFPVTKANSADATPVVQTQTLPAAEIKNIETKPKKIIKAKPILKTKTAKKLAKQTEKRSKGNNKVNKKSNLAVSKGRYALQVIALSHEDALKRFIAQHKLQNQTRYFKILRNGKPTFVLVYGAYPTHDAAVRAAANLPKSLQIYKPWPRKLTQ